MTMRPMQLDMAQQGCPTCREDGFVTVAKDNAAATICPHIATCTVCGGRGRMSQVDENGHSRIVACSCGALGARKRVALFNQARLPARFHDAQIAGFVHTAETFEIKRAFVALQDHFEPGNRGIGLCGIPGVGKTHLMAGLARYLTLHRGLKVMFTDFSHLLWSLKEGFNNRRSESELVRPLVEVDVLFIDELGKGRGTPWELGIVDEIVSQRYNRGLSLFFATNHPFEIAALSGNANHVARDRAAMAMEPLSDRVGLRIWSRLQQMCRLEVLRGRDARPSMGRNGQPQPGAGSTRSW